MTEKQMISTLKGLTFGTVVGSKGVEALEMAIQALSQEPCDEKKDCSTCKYEEYSSNNQPCRDCGTLLESYTNWEQKERELPCIYDLKNRYCPRLNEHGMLTYPQEPCDLLIIKSDIFMHQDERRKWMESIKQEKENGVIILPPYFEPLLVPNDIEIKMEQEPCDDAISREAVLSLFDKSTFASWDLTLLEHRIKELPSVTQKSGKWIPVSERLPEDGTYLVTVERLDGEPRIDMKSFAKDLHKVDEFDFPKHKSGWYDYDSEYGYWEDTKVIVWMPLPKPYEPQEREDV